MITIQYLYTAQGNAVAYVRGRFIHALSGKVIGQIVQDTHVHKLSGAYVGELYKDMVLDMHLGNRGNVGNPGNPGNAGNPGNPGNRGYVNYGYPDVVARLFDD